MQAPTRARLDLRPRRSYAAVVVGLAWGKTRDQVARNMYEAIEMHVRGLLEDKLPVPDSTSFAEYISIPA